MPKGPGTRGWGRRGKKKKKDSFECLMILPWRVSPYFSLIEQDRQLMYTVGFLSISWKWQHPYFPWFIKSILVYLTLSLPTIPAVASVIIPFYRWGNANSERPGSLCEVSQAAKGSRVDVNCHALQQLKREKDGRKGYSGNWASEGFWKEGNSM